MNVESGWGDSEGAAPVALTVGPAVGFGRPRRRRWWAWALLAAGLLALAWGLWQRSRAKPAPPPAKAAASVTVIVPGRQSVAREITATGNLAARRELPVGAAGEGGQVNAVLVEAGTWVREGQVLAAVDRRVQTEQAASLAASIRVAEADARLAQSELDRAQALVGRGFISRADIDRKTAARDSARARVNVARAQLGQAQASTSRLDIRAPAAGLVLERRVEPGQVVGPGSGVLFRIARGGEMELLARVGEGELQHLTVGLPATVTPVGTQAQFKGQIWQVSPVVDPQTRQGIARVALGYDPAIRPGGFAAARILTGAGVVPLLPESAVLSDERGHYVMVVNASNKVERRAVQVGDVTTNGLPIMGGLVGNERVVLSAGAFLNPGEPVTPVRAATPAAGGAQ